MKDYADRAGTMALMLFSRRSGWLIAAFSERPAKSRAETSSLAGAPQLRLMLQPYTLKLRLKVQDAARSGSIVARVQTEEGGKPVNVVSPLAGEVARLLVQDGAKVGAGNLVAVIAPGEAQVWESLRALYLVGQLQDLDDVERLADGVPNMSERVRRQAETAAQAIRQRTVQSKH